MIDLGEKIKSDEAVMYPATADKKEEKVRYPSICLPMKILGDKKPSVGDKIIVEVEGIVTGLREDKWVNEITIEAHEGEVESEAQEEKEESLLGKGE